ncbi:hypothetical protein [Bradyrhizobium japonicum]|jgi:hypothetical protein|uniref:hypothetical protein n=1 Tax=Bradyrhizobium japonicum TaxID=375 RepID=UPI001CB6CF49|nr:hypothetical protein [Bradyrhizobium japonicum]
MGRSARLSGCEIVGDRERIERHGQPGVPKSLQGEQLNAHGGNALKVVVYDNTVRTEASLACDATATGTKAFIAIDR